MSGIDEVGSRGMPSCPNCGSETSYWVLRNKLDIDLGFLNYNVEFAKDNGEFNMERSIDAVLRDTTIMICSSCKHKASETLLREGLGALRKDARRHPKYVRNR